MHDRLLDYIRRLQLMRAGDRVGAAVSGGSDSVALLRLLLDIRSELGIVLSVVHFNHKLRGEESEADEQFVRELAAAHSLEFFCSCGDTRAYAEQHKCGIEAAARDLRYGFFWELLSPRGAQGNEEEDLSPQRTQRAAKERLDRVATAHTMDDQAETVLMRFLRGSGTRGLSGIHPFVGEAVRTGNNLWQGPGMVRPLLEFRRAQLRHYLKRSSQPWREDASNADPAYTRNKLRQELMPKVREFNQAAEQVLSETAEIARAEEDYWSEQVGRVLIECAPRSTTGIRRSAIDIVSLMSYPLALQRRMIRSLAAQEGVSLDFHHVQQICEIAASPPTRAEKVVELPGGFEAAVRDRELWFRRSCPTQVGDYEFLLAIPGETQIKAAGLSISAQMASASKGDVLQHSIVKDLRVRNWRPGDRYQPGHSGSVKKLKELLQSRYIPAEARPRWPVVVARLNGSDTIVWVPGLAMADQFRETQPERAGLLLEYWVQG